MSDQSMQRGPNYDWKQEAEHYREECDKLRALLHQVEVGSEQREWKLEAENAKLQAECAAYRETLQFYKNPKNFSGVYRDPETDEIVAETDSIEMDVSEHSPDGCQQEFGMVAAEALYSNAGRALLEELNALRRFWLAYNNHSNFNRDSIIELNEATRTVRNIRAGNSPGKDG